MKNKLILLFINLMFLTNLISAQDCYKNMVIATDSLKAIISTGGLNDYQKNEIYHEISVQYFDWQLDSCFLYANKAHEIAEKIDDYILLANSFNTFSDIYIAFNKLEEAIIYEKKSRELARSHNDSIRLSHSYVRLGKAYMKNYGEYETAEKYLDSAFTIAVKMNYMKRIVQCNHLYGLLNFIRGDLDKAEDYINEVLPLYKENDQELGIAACFVDLGNIEKERGNLNNALQYFKNANKIYIENENLFGIYNSSAYISIVLDLQNKPEQSKKEALKSINMGKKYKDIYALKVFYEMYYNYYKKENKFDKALEYYQHYVTYRDSVADKYRVENLNKMEKEFTLEKKRKENEVLALQLKNRSQNLYLAITIFSIILLIVFIVYIQKIKKRKINQLKLKEYMTKSELLSLQYKINPHFLFNSLNSISQLVTKKHKNAEVMINNLSNLLRYTLTFAGKKLVKIEEEVEAVEQYLNMEKIRFSDRLEYEIAVDPGLENYFIPPLTIQPLVENSIKHGISNLIKGGYIKVFVKKKDTNIQINVIDNGKSNNNGNGLLENNNMGLGHESIINRLKIMYDDQYRFSVENGDETYSVTIELPAKI